MSMSNTTLVFTVAHALIVDVPAPAAPPRYAGHSARQLCQLYRATSDTRERQLIADAIRALHLVRGERLLGWLVEEQKYTDLVARNVPYLAQGHCDWLGHVQTQIEAETVALDHGEVSS